MQANHPCVHSHTQGSRQIQNHPHIFIPNLDSRILDTLPHQEVEKQSPLHTFHRVANKRLTPFSNDHTLHYAGESRASHTLVSYARLVDLWGFHQQLIHRARCVCPAVVVARPGRRRRAARRRARCRPSAVVVEPHHQRRSLQHAVVTFIRVVSVALGEVAA